jgi:hypothetical protein
MNLSVAARIENLTQPAARPAFELVMRDSPDLSQALLDKEALPSWTGQLLGISVLGLAIHGAAVGLVSKLLLERGASFVWVKGSVLLWMPLTFVGALLGALAICLPTFYFYTQLSGLDASFRLVTAQALRVQAKTSVLLLAALPFYVALALGSVVTKQIDPGLVVACGLGLPFLVGLVGIRSLYRGFVELLEVLPITHRRRGDFLLRMVLCWGAVYSVVAPVSLWRLGEWLGRVL